VSLRRTLVLPQLVLGGVVLVGLAGMAVESARQLEVLQRRAHQVRTSSQLVARLQQLAGQAERATLAYRFDRLPERVDVIEHVDLEAQQLDAAIARLPGGGERAGQIWSECLAARQLQGQVRAELLDAVRGRNELRIRTGFDKWVMATDLASALLADLAAFTSRQLDAAVDQIDERRARSMWILATFVGVSALATLAYSLFVSREVLRPLLGMTATAERIARDQVALPVPGRGRDDEIGVLADAFERMTGHLVLARARLEEAVKARDEFLSIASHELRTPLTSLELQLALLQRRAGNGDLSAERGRSGLDSARRQVDRLERLVGELLDVSRIQAGKLQLRRERVDLGEVVRAVATRFAAELERSGNTVALELAPGVVGHWDGERLDRVISNLLANAIKYAPGGPVTVAVGPLPGGGGRLQVRDDGPGIAPELQARIFDRFERADSRRGIAGLGLGLYIVRQIVEAHGGTVSVESAPGSGATFTVDLPGREEAATG
jgi:signal transduction histidine kinase